ncbi:MAG TPA: ATP-binding protein [Candidatus Dormibacteraeota bacterium]|nr:ATP-binding protein [Candidatus Dormibacteraeota bacterium]
MIASTATGEGIVLPDRRRPAAADLGSTLERDRRAGAERTIEVGRWVMLIYAAITANFPAPTGMQVTAVNALLGAWAVFNLVLTVTLLAGHIPAQRMQYLMTALDILVATALVALTGGFTSPFAISFFAVVIASSLRFGLLGSLCCALLVSLVDLFTGMAVSGWITRSQLDTYLSHLFLYLVVALVSSLLVREMVRSRADRLEHTHRLEHAAFQELREVDRLKSEFIMLASHELRTPLAKVRGWLSLMHDAGDRLPPEAHAEGLEVLRGEIEHLARLTDNLLCIAQLESGEIRLKTRPVVVGHLVDQVLTRFVEAADRPRIQTAVGDGASIVLADPDRLALALACLIDNALKFGPESEIVTVGSIRDGASVRIEVHDLGRRIPDDQIERIFLSFYQLESPLTRQRGGAGVGLYLARQLVERMGGRIWADNHRGRGNSFCILLPADG